MSSGSGQAPVVTLDGPGGSGKGTVGQLLAQRLGWHFLDSGALYRAVGHVAREQGLTFDDEAGVAALARALQITFVPQDGAPPRVLADGRDVSGPIRTEEAGEGASKVAVLPAVRDALLQKQRDFQRFPGLVADGRDMGTTVFPAAPVKVFVTASPEVRAERRYKQLKEKGFGVNLARLLGEIRERDARDAQRPVSPLRPAADADILDTSRMSIAEVVDYIYGLVRRTLNR